jgi:hypothetical protein
MACKVFASLKRLAAAAELAVVSTFARAFHFVVLIL